MLTNNCWLHGYIWIGFNLMWELPIFWWVLNMVSSSRNKEIQAIYNVNIPQYKGPKNMNRSGFRGGDENPWRVQGCVVDRGTIFFCWENPPPQPGLAVKTSGLQPMTMNIHTNDTHTYYICIYDIWYIWYILYIYDIYDIYIWYIYMIYIYIW